MSDTTLTRVIKQLINLGRTAGLREKIDVLYVAGSLDDDQYQELVEMLPEE